jgi:hypothetical protein
VIAQIKTLLVVVCVASGLMALEAKAADNGKGYFGPIGGLAFPSGSSAAFMFGFSGAYRFGTSWGAGPFYMHYGVGAAVDDSTGSATVESSTSYYGVEPVLMFGGSLAHFLLGAKVGLASFRKNASAKDSSSSIEIDQNSTYLFLAPKVAYDYPVGRFSFGGELGYILGIGSYGPSAVLTMGTVKFWF